MTEDQRLRRNAAVARWQVRNPERVRAYASTHRRTKPASRMFYRAKDRALAKGLPFSITLANITIPDVCPVLGIPLVVGEGRIEDGSPSLDRIKPELGYVPGNVVVMSSLANRIKTNANAAQVRAVADWMEQHDTISE